VQKQRVAKQPQADTFEKKPATQPRNIQNDCNCGNHDDTKHKVNARALICTILFLLSNLGSFMYGLNKNNEEVYFDYSDFNIGELADAKDIDPKVLYLANNFVYNDAEDIISGAIIRPERYETFLQDEVAEISEKLAETELSEEKKAKLLSKLSDLKERQKIAEELFDVYYANENYYIIPKKPNIPTAIAKDVFKISDGYLSKEYSDYYRNNMTKYPLIEVGPPGEEDTYYDMDAVPVRTSGIIVDKNHFNQKGFFE